MSVRRGAVRCPRCPTDTLAHATVEAAIQFDGKWFVARCLDLPVTSQGETLEATKMNLKEAIELYIETWGADEARRRLASLNSRK